MNREKLIMGLDSENKKERAKNLTALLKGDRKHKEDVHRKPKAEMNVATCYSFSCYTPSKAAFMAYNSGLSVCGVTDYLSLEGAEEFAQACAESTVHYAIGVKVPALIDKERRNVIIYGIGLHAINTFKTYLAPCVLEHEKVVKNVITAVNKRYGLGINFDQVSAHSHSSEGGTILVKHVFAVAAEKVMEREGKADSLVRYLRSRGIELTEFEIDLLLDDSNIFAASDLMRIMYRSMNYTEWSSSIPVNKLVSDVKKMGGFCAYIASPDEFKDKINLAHIKKLGFDAISVDTIGCTQLSEILNSCEEQEILFIPHNEIDNPRKKFDLGEMDERVYKNCLALAGNQKMVNLDQDGGLFSEKMIKGAASLAKRVELCAEIAKREEK